MRKALLPTLAEPAHDRVFRLEFGPRHIALALVVLVLAFGAGGAYYVASLRHATARTGELRAQTIDQQAQLHKIGAQAAELGSELHSLQRQNDEIKTMVGGDHLRPPAQPAPPENRQSYRPGDDYATVAARIERLRADSSGVRQESASLRRLALRVLNVHRLEEIARARVLAAIPSINPGGNGVAIRSPFGWRVDPWPEFHQGVDLDVDYGDDVRAAAAGTVVAAGYAGGYGIKVDIDHGNGYHTWYCHLSRADVRPGEYVRKSEHIALVGSTGMSTGPHLHYQIMKDGVAIDPTPYLAGVPGRVLASLH